MNLLRKIGIVFVPVYFGITWLRNWLYDRQFLPSKNYPLPIIAVGNLSVGGTGKTPMVGYILELFESKKNLAMLSRGFGRSTTGFRIVSTDSSALDVGDEPLQLKKTFPECMVVVDADRQNGIAKLQEMTSPPELIILDDAFQHRKVRAGLYILLTAYNDLYVSDSLLPTGNLREPISGAKRAAIVVVTKCPNTLSLDEQNHIETTLGLLPTQKLYFTTIKYAPLVKAKDVSYPIAHFKTSGFCLVTGIANPKPLLTYYKNLGCPFRA